MLLETNNNAREDAKVVALVQLLNGHDR